MVYQQALNFHITKCLLMWKSQVLSKMQFYEGWTSGCILLVETKITLDLNRVINICSKYFGLMWFGLCFVPAILLGSNEWMNWDMTKYFSSITGFKVSTYNFFCLSIMCRASNIKDFKYSNLIGFVARVYFLIFLPLFPGPLLGRLLPSNIIWVVLFLAPPCSP